MATVVAAVATPEDEVQWVALAGQHTVRQIRGMVAEHAERETRGAEEQRCAEPEQKVALDVAMDRSEAWLIDCVRLMVRRVSGETGDEAVMEALLAEGQSSLLGVAPEALSGDLETPDGWAMAHKAWVQQRARWRDQAEALCESRAWRSSAGVGLSENDGSTEPSFVGSADAVDEALCDLSRQLLKRDIMVGELAERFWRQDGWRRLGYATGGQYARERLGAHLSGIEAKRRLARQLERLPDLRRAVGHGEVGYEAARLVARVATPGTVRAWVARARGRTVVHLREEIEAAEMLGRISEEADMLPPSEETMRGLRHVEGEIISGRAFAEALRSAPCDGAAAVGVPPKAGAEMSAGGWSDDGGEMIAAVAMGETEEVSAGGSPDDRAEMFAGVGPNDPGATIARGATIAEGRQIDESATRKPARGATLAAVAFSWLVDGLRQSRRTPGLGKRGRVTIRLRVSSATRAYFRQLEKAFNRQPWARTSFVTFLCEAFISTWNDALDTGEAYASIYARDGYRCQSPVCRRRGVTPHHLRYRSAGGGDEPENLVALCVWCHLEGIHGGRLRATAPASAIRWTLGRRAHTKVEGRCRVRC